MSKIAVPTTNVHLVDSHFGHCEFYTIFTIDDNRKITEKELYPSPKGCGCKSDIASVLHQKGVRVLLAGNMGDGALNVLNKQGIKVYRGCQGDVTKVVEEYLSGKVYDSGDSCKHDHPHASGHTCNH